MKEKNVFTPQQRNRDYCSKYISEPKFEPRHTYDVFNREKQKADKEAVETLLRGGTVEIVLNDEDKGEQTTIAIIKKIMCDENIKPIGMWSDFRR